MTEFCYKEIPDDRVDPGILRQSLIALGFCKKDLGLSDGIYIQWIRTARKEDKGCKKSPFGEFYGSIQSRKESHNKDRILIRADIPIEHILQTIVHESKHIADRDFDGDDSITGILSSREYRADPSEARANEYAKKAVPEIRKQIGLAEGLERLTKSLRSLKETIRHV